MALPKILITGATGKTGSVLVKELLTKNYPVRAFVRARSERSDRLARLGAEVVTGDLYDPQQIRSAMQGTQRAYYCPPMDPLMIQSAAAFATAAQQAKLEAIVGLSQWIASPEHPSLHTRQLWQAEQLFASLPGVAYVKLNPGYFADNYLRLMDFASLLGIFPILTGNSRNVPVSNEDIARTAAALLADPLRYAGQSFRPTGPQLLSAHDMVPILRRVLGHPVLGLDMPKWMFDRAARLQGENAFVIGALHLYNQDHKQGAFAHGGPTNVVEQLTGKPAEDFETTVRRYAAMPFARKTAANFLRVFFNFNLVPFTPGFNFKRYNRERAYPQIGNPKLAMQSEIWKATHGASAPLPSPAWID